MYARRYTTLERASAKRSGFPMPILYHYCSTAAFLSIISSHKIFASEFTLSNDLLEGRWIRQVVIDYCKEKSVDFFTTEAILSSIDRLVDYLGAAGICLSEEGDLLSQWRAYSCNGSGFSIGFDQSKFGDQVSPLPTLNKIAYDPAQQKRIIQPAMDSIVALANEGAGRPLTILGSAGKTEADLSLKEENDRRYETLVFSLFPHLYVLKNPAFQEEREWRSVTIVIPPDSSAPERESEGSGWLLNHMEFRALPDRIVPHTEFSLDRPDGGSTISEVIIGPRNVTPIRIVEAALLHHGWNNVKVTKSKASYR